MVATDFTCEFQDRTWMFFNWSNYVAAQQANKVSKSTRGKLILRDNPELKKELTADQQKELLDSTDSPDDNDFWTDAYLTTVWFIPDDSLLMEALYRLYGGSRISNLPGELVAKNVRSGVYDPVAHGVYFVTGTGYDWILSDVLHNDGNDISGNSAADRFNRIEQEIGKKIFFCYDL